MTEKISNQSYGSFSTPEISGVYTVKIAFINYLGEQEIVVQKLISQ